jgi:hypothetical protein
MHRGSPPCSTDLVEPSRFVDFEVWRLLKLMMNLYLIDLGLHLRLAEAA